MTGRDDDSAAAAYADWLRGPEDGEQHCRTCGAHPEEPCAKGCPEYGAEVDTCGSCQAMRGRWVESLGVYRCEACGPLTTAHVRMLRGDL